MTDSEINIAIAEACGWLKRVPCNKCGHGTHQWLTPDGLVVDKLTDYCHDLNAMHEAENMLTIDEQHSFVNHLANMLSCSYDFWDKEEDWKLTHSTARQRAEAFLRVKGLWRGEA